MSRKPQHKGYVGWLDGKVVAYLPAIDSAFGRKRTEAGLAAWAAQGITPDLRPTMEEAFELHQRAVALTQAAEQAEPRGEGKPWSLSDDLTLLTHGGSVGVDQVATHDLDRSPAAARRRLAWLRRYEPDLVAKHWRGEEVA